MPYSTLTNKYAHLWNKYRPAILKYMIDAADGPQQYRLSKHEFLNINPKEKGGHSFTLRVFQGKSIADKKPTVVATDLLLILQQSKTASALMEVSTYEFELDKQHMLHIKREDPPEAPEEETPEITEGETPEPTEEETPDKED